MRTTPLLAATLALAAACSGQQPQTKAAPTEECTSCALAAVAPDAKPSLKVRWKRGVDDQGETLACHRATEKALDTAQGTLQTALQPLGIEVSLEKAVLSSEDYRKDPLRSNRVWLNGATLSSYLPNAKVGAFKGTECGTACRTIEFAGQSFRNLTPELVVYAGLAAANESVQQMLSDAHAIGVANPAATAGMLGSSGSSCESGSCGSSATGGACCDTSGAASSCGTSSCGSGCGETGSCSTRANGACGEVSGASSCETSSCGSGAKSSSCGAGQGGCDSTVPGTTAPTLTVSWVRPVAPGTDVTPDCHIEAEKPVEAAVAMLKRSLEPMGVQVVLTKNKLACDEFKAAPLESNRIQFNGVEVTKFLPGSTTGSVDDEKLGYPRPTITFRGETHTFLPAELIAQAGMVAGAEVLKRSLAGTQPCCDSAGSSCCGTSNSEGKGANSSCGQSCDTEEKSTGSDVGGLDSILKPAGGT